MAADTRARWEHGSDFAWPELDPVSPRTPWLPSGASLWHSGRHALRALVEAERPRRVLFPSFYCQDVLDAAGGAEVRGYADGPEDARIDVAALELRAGDMLVVTNTYGLRPAAPLDRASLPEGVTLVEDHTHDPLAFWARSSTADFAFASLRKWLPLPDGAMLWSPAGRGVPEPPALSSAAAAITLDRLTGMVLKQRYLAGEDVAKDAYRARAIAGEGAIGRGEPQPMSPVSRELLAALPIAAWREARARNHDALAARLDGLAGARLLSRTSSTSTPYAFVLAFDDAARRDAVRAALVARSVYPAVLWPIDGARATGIPQAHVELAQRVLCLHCDHRYDAGDMERVALAVHAAFDPR